MDRMVGIAALAMLAACGYSEERFADDLTRAMCDKLVECELFPGDEDQCYLQTIDGEGDNTDCDYDPQAARECLSAIDSLTCPEEELLVPPAVCGDVYTNCGGADTGG